MFARCLCPAALVVTIGTPAFAAPGDAPQANEAPGEEGQRGEGSANALDASIRKMLDIAVEQGETGTVEAVFAIARKAAPAAATEIDALEDRWKAQLTEREAKAERTRLANLRRAGAFDNWKGEVEIGVSRASGNASSFGLLAALDLKREGFEWTHRLTAHADVQRASGEKTAERLNAAWQPSYRFAERTFAYGLLQYEHDPFAGYHHRYTLGGGLGYKALTGERLKLDLEGGPAIRRIDEVGGGGKTRLAGRASIDFRWRLNGTLAFTQKAAVYVEGRNGNVVAETALDARLIGDLKARFSYDIQYERNPPASTDSLNTQSRATFVYSF